MFKTVFIESSNCTDFVKHTSAYQMGCQTAYGGEIVKFDGNDIFFAIDNFLLRGGTR